MSTTETWPSYVPFSALSGFRLPTFQFRLAGAFSSMWARHAQAHGARSSVSSLASFNEHMLRDIGLARLDLDRSATLRRIRYTDCEDRRVMWTLCH